MTFIIMTSVDPSWPQMTLWSYWLQLTPNNPIKYILYLFSDSLDNQLLLGDIVELQPAMEKVSSHSMTYNDGHFLVFNSWNFSNIFWISDTLPLARLAYKASDMKSRGYRPIILQYYMKKTNKRSELESRDRLRWTRVGHTIEYGLFS